MRLNIKRWLVAACAAAVSFGGASVASAEEPQTGGTVNVISYYRTINALTWDYQKWIWKENHDGLHLDQLFAGDLQKGPRGTNENDFVAQAYIPPEHLRGEIANSFELKTDPLQLIFKLRPGVFWPATPGVMEKREVTAEDVAFHFTHMWTLKRKIPTYWSFIDRWEAKDKHTVIAHLNSYNANWAYRLAWGYFSAILPPEYHKLDDKARADWKNAVGSGPYKVADVVKSSHQTYVKNDDYWDSATIDGKSYKLPLNDKVVYHLIKDEATAIANIRTGKADIMEAIRWQFVDELKKSAPDLILKKGLSTTGTFIALRNDKKPFNDVRVRRAMNLAVNQREILQTLLNGDGSMLNYPFSSAWKSVYTPIDKLSAKGKELFDYNPKKAKQLLAEAGYPNGLEFELMYSSSTPYHVDLVPMLQAYYQRIGVPMKLKPLEYAAFRSQMRKDTQAVGYLMNNGSGNPIQVLRKSFVTGQTWNPAMHADEAFDKRWKAAAAETDPAKAHSELVALNRFIIEEKVPHVWLPTDVFYRAHWPWVKNYHGELRVGAVRPGPIYARIWIDQAMKKKMGF